MAFHVRVRLFCDEAWLAYHHIRVVPSPLLYFEQNDQARKQATLLQALRDKVKTVINVH